MNGTVKEALKLLALALAIIFAIWGLNVNMIDTKLEARCGPTDTKVEMLERKLDRIDSKLDRLLERGADEHGVPIKRDTDRPG